MESHLVHNRSFECKSLQFFKKLKKSSLIYRLVFIFWVSQVPVVVKNLCASAGDIRDVGLIPGLGISPGGGHGNPPQYYCLENPINRGNWQATILRVEKGQTLRKRLSTHTHLSSIMSFYKRICVTASYKLQR